MWVIKSDGWLFALTAHSGAHMEAESILVNVAGRLLLFQRDRSTASGKVPDTKEKRVRLFALVKKLSNDDTHKHQLFTHKNMFRSYSLKL